MKKFIIFAAFSIFVYNSFAQTKPITGPLTYGPVPYRTLEQTIGEDYVVLPMNQFEKKSGYFGLKIASDPKADITDSTIIGKRLKLKTIDSEHTAHLMDDVGTEYVCELVNNIYQDIAPLYDINESKKKNFEKRFGLIIPIYSMEEL